MAPLGRARVTPETWTELSVLALQILESRLQLPKREEVQVRVEHRDLRSKPADLVQWDRTVERSSDMVPLVALAQCAMPLPERDFSPIRPPAFALEPDLAEGKSLAAWPVQASVSLVRAHIRARTLTETKSWSMSIKSMFAAHSALAVSPLGSTNVKESMLNDHACLVAMLDDHGDALRKVARPRAKDALPRLRRLQRRVPDPRSLPELKSGAANFRTAEPAEPSRSSRLREVVSERSLANFLTRQDQKAIETPGSGKPPRTVETWKPLRVLCDPRAFHRRRHFPGVPAWTSEGFSRWPLFSSAGVPSPVTFAPTDKMLPELWTVMQAVINAAEGRIVYLLGLDVKCPAAPTSRKMVPGLARKVATAPAPVAAAFRPRCRGWARSGKTPPSCAKGGTTSYEAKQSCTPGWVPSRKDWGRPETCVRPRGFRRWPLFSSAGVPSPVTLAPTDKMLPELWRVMQAVINAAEGRIVHLLGLDVKCPAPSLSFSCGHSVRFFTDLQPGVGEVGFRFKYKPVKGFSLKLSPTVARHGPGLQMTCSKAALPAQPRCLLSISKQAQFFTEDVALSSEADRFRRRAWTAFRSTCEGDSPLFIFSPPKAPTRWERIGTALALPRLLGRRTWTGKIHAAEGGQKYYGQVAVTDNSASLESRPVMDAASPKSFRSAPRRTGLVLRDLCIGQPPLSTLLVKRPSKSSEVCFAAAPAQVSEPSRSRADIEPLAGGCGLAAAGSGRQLRQWFQPRVAMSFRPMCGCGAWQVERSSESRAVVPAQPRLHFLGSKISLTVEQAVRACAKTEATLGEDMLVCFAAAPAKVSTPALCWQVQPPPAPGVKQMLGSGRPVLRRRWPVPQNAAWRSLGGLRLAATLGSSGARPRGGLLILAAGGPRPPGAEGTGDSAGGDSGAYLRMLKDHACLVAMLDDHGDALRKVARPRAKDALPRLRRLQRRVPDPRSLPELKSGAANFRTAEPAEPSRSSRLREVVSERSLANFLTRQDRKAIETPGSGKPPRPVIETWKPLRVLCDPGAFHRRRHLCDRLLPGAAELLLGDYALIVQQHSLHRPPQFGAEEGRWKVESGGTCSPARTERRQRRNILFQLKLKLPLVPFKHSSAQRRDAPLPVALPVACRKPMVPMERRSFLCLQNLAMPPSTFVPKLTFGESRLQAKRPWLTCASRQAIETVSALALGGADEQLFAGAAPLALRVGFRALDAFGRKTEEEAEEGKAVRERDMLLFTGSQLQEVRDLYPFLQETDTEPAEGRPPEAAFQQLTSRTVLAAGKRRFPLPKRRAPPPRGPAPRPAARPPRLRGPRQRGRPGGCKVLIVGGLGFRKRKDEMVLKTVTMSGLENTMIQPLCAGERLGFPNKFASIMLMGGRYLDQMDFDDLVLMSLSFAGESVMKVAEHMERSSRPARGVVLWDWMSPAPTIHAGYNRFDEQILRAAQEDPRRAEFLHLWNMAESCSLRLKSAFFLHAVQVENEEQVDFIEEECAQRSALAIRFQDLRSAHLDEDHMSHLPRGWDIARAILSQLQR